MSRRRGEFGLLLALAAAVGLVWLLVDLRTRSADASASMRTQLQGSSLSTSEQLVEAAPEPVPTTSTIPTPRLTDTEAPTVEIRNDSPVRPASRSGEQRTITAKPIVVWGIIRDSRQEPVDLAAIEPPWTRIFVESETVYDNRASFLADSQYGIDGVAPGAWTVRADVPGYFPWSEDVLLLPTDRQRRVDIELEAYPRLRVRIKVDGPARQLDSVSIRRSLMDAGTGGMLAVRPVVTKGPPPELLPNVERHSLGEFDVWPRGGSGTTSTWDEVLEIHCRLPVHVSAAMGDRILRTVEAGPGDNEVVLVVTSQEIDKRLATLRFKVTDGDGKPPPTSVACNLWRDVEAGTLSELPPSSTSGEFLLERMLPGPLGIEIKAPGFAHHVIETRIEPGLDKDLGEIRLQPETSIRGRVLDPDGRPARARVKCEPLSRSSRSRLLNTADQYGAGTVRGEFEISGLPRGRYAIRAMNDPGYNLVSTPLQVSTETDSIDGVEIRLERTSLVEIRLRPPPPGSCVIFVEGADHLPVDEREPSFGGTTGFQLPRGRYHARAVVCGEVIATAEFEAVGHWMPVIMKPR